ncbi:MAG: hypothetical protein ACRDWE_03300, partial [Acidimicrobiales bacterium]
MGVRRPELVLAAAMALSLPMLPSIMNGAISVASGFLRFAVALALCWAAGAVIERVYDTYSRAARQAQIQKAIAEARTRLDQSAD